MQHSKASTYDYVIVGAGSAGCVLANRLTADSNARVLLLEAGGTDHSALIEVPLGLGKMSQDVLFDWGYSSENQVGLGGRTMPLPRGKVLGGSSSTNYMTFTRGHPADYDRWAHTGLAGWGYRDVLPYFKRLETWSGPSSQWRGSKGPIGVQFAKSSDPLFAAIMAAAKAAGYPATDDFNGENPVGFGRSQNNIRNGRRSSTSIAYLRPVLGRANLTVRSGALTHRVVIEGTKARGVEYSTKQGIFTANADREVILCAGTYNTPQLLMLSGIGPADHLRDIGISPIVDLRVGDNLQDHLFVPMQWKRRGRGAFHSTMRFDRIGLAMIQAYAFGSGLATVLPNGVNAYLKTSHDSAVPDIEFLVRGAPYDARPWFPIVAPAYADGFAMMPAILHPESRGQVRLRSADPAAPVRINSKYLDVEADVVKLREGVSMVRNVANQAELASFHEGEIFPGKAVASDAAIDGYIRSRATSVSHPAGTARMGTDDDAVLDAELRVRGIDSLRVVDASAMPDLVSAHINACVMMMAEKAADLLAGKTSSD